MGSRQVPVEPLRGLASHLQTTTDSIHQWLKSSVVCIGGEPVILITENYRELLPGELTFIYLFIYLFIYYVNRTKVHEK